MKTQRKYPVHSYHCFSKLSDPEGSFALLSRNLDVNTAIVFVHGFAGHPRHTWVNFEGLIDDAQAHKAFWERSDLFFYCYKSMENHIFYNGDTLQKFLNRIFPIPPVEILTVKFDSVEQGVFTFTTISLDERCYKNLVLVGHSEGGLVIRQAVYNTAKALANVCPKEAFISAAEKSLLTARLRLFAPALLGVNLSGLMGVVAKSSSFGTIMHGLFHGSRAYADMSNPEKISELKNGTEHFADNTDLSAFCAQIRWAEHDSYVTPGSYRCDTDTVVRGTNHVSVCKPTFIYRDPLEFVSG